MRDNYIGETVKNTVTRWSEHNNPEHKSEPAEDIKSNIDHTFNWKILLPSSKTSQEELRSNFCCIILNDKRSFDRLMLFKNGITWFLFDLMN